MVSPSHPPAPRSAPPPRAADLVPLSGCDLWRRQSAFFRKHGIRSWARGVPYYITSNPGVADAYAQVILRAGTDWAAAGTAPGSGPVYVLELGAGHGQLGFHLARRLAELRCQLGARETDFVYVMTDFCEGIVEHWRRQPQLRELAAQGVLDFAVFDLERSEEVVLLEAGKPLGAALAGDGAGRPLVAIANYVFDTVSHDLFRFTGGRVQEALVAASPRVPTADEGTSFPLSRLGGGLRFREVEPPYYRDADFDAVVAGYRREMEEGYLLVPVGALRSVRRLLDLSGGRLLLLATDKGFSRHLPAYCAEEPWLSFHGSMSMMVNLDLIGRYFELRGGEAVHQRSQQCVVTSLFLAGSRLGSLPGTRLAAAELLEGRSPSHRFALYQHLAATRTEFTLESMTACIEATGWDPEIFNLFLQGILARLPEAQATAVADLAAALHRVAANVYDLPGSTDTWANLAVAFQRAGDHRAALLYFRQSAGRRGERPETLYGMGVCQYLLGRPDDARASFQAVVDRRPQDVQARGWIARIEAEAGGGAAGRAEKGDVDAPAIR